MPRHRLPSITLCAAAALIAASHASVASTWFVNGACGDDSWSGHQFFCLPIFADGPKRTIQAAINAASNGDLILILPGTYAENLLISNKSLTLQGPSDPYSVVITNDVPQTSAVTIVNSPAPVAFEHIDFKNSDVQFLSPVYIDGSAVSFSQCLFQDNDCGSSGAIMALGSDVLVTDCNFIENYGDTQSGVLYASAGSTVSFSGCNFVLNSTSLGGGIVRIGQSAANVAFTSCRFDSNGSDDHANFAWIQGSSLVKLDQCFVFDQGGDPQYETFYATGNAIVLLRGSTLFNSTFLGTTLMRSTVPATILLTNTILGGNFAALSSGPVEVGAEYSCLPIVFPGEGNVAGDPLFTDTSWPATYDFRLQSGSPCIDAGSNTAELGMTADLNGDPRFMDDLQTPDTGEGKAPVIDIGAYEFQPPSVPEDLNGDGSVNGLDLALLLGVWTGSASYSPCPPSLLPDFNEDCKINGTDLALLLGAWS